MLDLSLMIKLLGRSTEDKIVISSLKGDLCRITRDEYYGSINYIDDGFDIVFQEEAWIFPDIHPKNEELLYISAFHLHREGHEGFRQFQGQLAGDLFFGCPFDEVLRKLGSPDVKGGEGSMMGINVPLWMKYFYDVFCVHCQFDVEKKLEMMTISYPEK